MRHIRKLLAIASASAAFAFAVPANAAVVLCSSGPGIDLTVDQCTAPGNDDLASVEASIAAATGVSAALLNLVLYGKSDDNAALFSFSPDADPDNQFSTDWTVLDGTLIKYVTIKAAGNFKVYELPGAGASSGIDFNSFGLLTPNLRTQAEISHLSFWTVPEAPVPEPSTWALMLVGFGAVGWGMRRRKSAAQQPRIRVLYS